ncbi:hypothetical protein AX15_002902 [Amanita polypyramis BW_CC]|nr:hypothetical protein AX15_002902 [Amanita polypyramis BW_CC]
MAKHSLDHAPETPSKRPRCTLSARPSDSPSNPFGRKRVRTLVKSLPPPTPFSKHLPLRFQFVCTNQPTPRLHGGVHRIVQVPTNYTFMHLRCLIAFLFGDRRSILLQGEGHLFEVKRKIHLFSMNYKPGQVRFGQTWAKLSSAKDPCRYRPESNLTEVEGKEPPSTLGKTREEEEPGEWKWHAEEDFTLERAWPKGCDLARAIVYHHNSTTQVHITINTIPVERRKGVSNAPYVFEGRGLVSLIPAVIPKPLFSLQPVVQTNYGSTSTRSLRSRTIGQRSIKNAQPSSSSKFQEQDLTDQDVEGESDPEAIHLNVDDSDASQEEKEPDDIQVTLDHDNFNIPDAFSDFFSRCQRLARSRLQFGSGFGQEYDLTSSDEDESDTDSLSPSTLLVSSSPSKYPRDCSSPATSLFESLTGANNPKTRGTASPPPQTSSPGPSSPISSPALNKSPSSRRRRLHRQPASSPGNVFEPRANLSLKKPRHSSLLQHLPFHPSPSGFPKYTPLPDRGKLYKMRIDRIEKRVERMKSLEWLKVPDEEEENEKKKKKEEEARKKKKEEELRTLDGLMGGRKGPGGILEMGVRRGKKLPPQSLLTIDKGEAKERPELGRVSSNWHPFDDDDEEEIEV